MLDRGLLSELDQFSEDPAPEQLERVRQVLCVAIGTLRGFLLDTLGHLLACDPRGKGNADYVISRKFPRDVEEAEWLFKSINQLQELLQALDEQRKRCLSARAQQLQESARPASPEQWAATSALLEQLSERLTPALKNVLGLRGVRIDELRIIDLYIGEIPSTCQVIVGSP